jgi:hypothetical protein
MFNKAGSNTTPKRIKPRSADHREDKLNNKQKLAEKRTLEAFPHYLEKLVEAAPLVEIRMATEYLGFCNGSHFVLFATEKQELDVLKYV